MLTHIPLFVAIVFTAGFIQGAGGFGFGIFAMAFLTLLFTVKDAVLISVTLGTITSVAILIQLYRHIAWRNIVPLLVGAVLGRLAAFPILRAYGDTPALQYWLAIALAFFSLQLLYKSFRTTAVIVDMPPSFAVILGLLSGITGGLFSTGGPWLVLYFLSTQANKLAYKANMQVAFVVSGVFTIGLHGVSGDYSVSMLQFALIGAITTAVGSRLGVWASQHLQPVHIRRWACVIILLTSVNTLLGLW